MLMSAKRSLKLAIVRILFFFLHSVMFLCVVFLRKANLNYFRGLLIVLFLKKSSKIAMDI